MARPALSLAAAVLISTAALSLSIGAASASEGTLAAQAAARAAAVSGPAIEVTPSSHDFGRVNVGDVSSTSDFTITNTGTEDLHITLSLGGSNFMASADDATILPGHSTLLHTSFQPQSGAGGLLNANVSITSDAVNGTFHVLLVGTANNAPAFSPPLASSYTAPAFLPFSLDATASDPEGDDLSWSLASTPPLPVGATFVGITGSLSWTPDAMDAGDYAVTITVSDGLAETDGAFTLHVMATNNPPVANAGGPYNGVVGVPIQFIGSGSSDPDAGQSLTFAWDFGDGATSTAVNPTHAYSSQGTRLVVLTVTDNGTPVLSNTITTTASAVNFIAAEILADGNDGHIKTNGNGAQNFAIEVFSRNVTDLDQSSIKVSTTTPNAGTVSEITINLKGVHVGDFDKDLIGDLDFQIRASQIKPLLIHVRNGTMVTLVFTVKTISDAVTVRGTIDLIKTGSSATVAVSAPNPFPAGAPISYSLANGGAATLRIYSAGGRLVRTLRDTGDRTAGIRRVAWDGRNDRGERAGAGIYFVQVTADQESAVRKVMLLR